MKQTDVIEILVTSTKRKSKDGKRRWVQLRTKMDLVIVGQEEKGKQEKWVNLTLCGKDLSKRGEEITRGVLKIRVSDMTFPKVYNVTETEDENGEIKKVYPEVKVFNYESFEPREREVENPFVTVEKDTSETEIDTGDEFDSVE